jgi:predicted AlkP superfamily pyrophosphatase or phosphodiesterase
MANKEDMPPVSDKYTMPQRLLYGAVAGFVVGLLLGSFIAFRIAQVNHSLYSPFLQGELRLHLAAIYGVLMIIPGLALGALLLGRRGKAGPIARVILILTAVLIFYYGQKWLSFNLWAHFGANRLPLEIIGFLAWGVVCWLLYKLLLFLEKPSRGWVVKVFLFVALFSLAWSAIQIVRQPSDRKPPLERPALPAPKQNVKVALIGIDGAWWEMIDPLMEAGRMPAFQSLVQRGVRCHLHTLLPTLSPRIWSTIATGKVPEKHHITSFTTWTFPITGVSLPLTTPPHKCWEFSWMLNSLIQVAPINATFRGTEPIWDILSDAGASVGVVNWWATYPAEPVDGYIVSDQALYNKFLRYAKSVKAQSDSDRHQSPERDPQTVFPPQLLPELLPLLVNPQDIPVDSIARFIHFQTDLDRKWYQNAADTASGRELTEAAIFKYSYPEDVTIIQVALHLLDTYQQPAFFALYLNGLDIMQHKYLPYYFHHRHQDILTPEDIARLKDLVPEYYVYMDEILAKITKALDPNTIIIVVSDHGFDHVLGHDGIYTHAQAPPGVFLIAGDGIEQDKTIPAASVQDIVPTVLRLFGLPIGRDMDGRVLTEAFDIPDQPITWVDTYDTEDRSRSRVESKTLDKALQEKLKALGYIK